MTSNIAIIGLGVMATRMITNLAAYGGARAAVAWDPAPDACRRGGCRFVIGRRAPYGARAYRG